jgi:hypothetical protein
MKHLKCMKRNPFIDNQELLQKMLLERSEGKSLKVLSWDYKCAYSIIKEECLKHGLGSIQVKILTRERKKNGFTLAKEVSQEFALRQTSKEAMRNRWEYRDDTGDRINRGHSYEHYLRQHYGQEGVNKIKKRQSEVL